MLSLVGRHRFRSHGNFNEAKFSNEIKHDDHRTTTKKLCRNEIKLYVYTVYVHVQPCVVQWQYRNESRIFSSFPHFLGFHLEKKTNYKANKVKSSFVLSIAIRLGCWQTHCYVMFNERAHGNPSAYQNGNNAFPLGKEREKRATQNQLRIYSANYTTKKPTVECWMKEVAFLSNCPSIKSCTRRLGFFISLSFFAFSVVYWHLTNALRLCGNWFDSSK